MVTREYQAILQGFNVSLHDGVTLIQVSGYSHIGFYVLIHPPPVLHLLQR